MTKAQKETMLQARRELRSELVPGETIYSIVRHVARSGMQRDISFLVMRDGRPNYITTRIAEALGMRSRDYRGHWTLIVGGCGLDLCVRVVDVVSSALGMGKGERFRSEQL